MAGKADIVDALAGGVEGLSRKQAAEAFDLVFDTIAKYLRRDDRVQVPGFGGFSASKRGARKGRNPSTGAAINDQGEPWRPLQARQRAEGLAEQEKVGIRGSFAALRTTGWWR